MKRCSNCARLLEIAEFGPDKSKRDGLNHRCRECDNSRGRDWYHKRGGAKVKAMTHKRRAGEKRIRICLACDQPASSSRHWYCDRCRQGVAYLRDPAKRSGRRRRDTRKREMTTTERGYGTVHQKQRAKYARLVDSGRAICARCHRPIDPGEPWDLGHDDDDRTKYKGPEHASCNRAAANRRRAGEKRNRRTKNQGWKW